MPLAHVRLSFLGGQMSMEMDRSLQALFAGAEDAKGTGAPQKRMWASAPKPASFVDVKYIAPWTQIRRPRK
jgi:hypothetical protein